jgi:hypothetical protein
MLESYVQTSTSRDVPSRLLSIQDLCRSGGWKFRGLDYRVCWLIFGVVGRAHGCVRTGTLNVEALPRSLGLYLIVGSW